MKGLEICYEDSELIIVNKPSGMLSIPDRFEHNAPNVKRFLQNQNYNPTYNIGHLR